MNMQSYRHVLATAEHAPAYRPDIDGLRAIAVTSVVLFHTGIATLQGGFAGVDIFFVISGFLIGAIIYRGVKDGSFSFATFYARRARRIAPALLVVTCCTIVASIMLLSPAELREASLSGATALIGVSNIRFWKSLDYFSPTAETDPFLMTWSLGVEEQFYIFFPFVVLMAHRLKGGRFAALVALLCVASFVLCAISSFQVPAFAFYLLPARAWELGVGVLLAIYVTSGRRLPAGRVAEAISAVSAAMLMGSLLFITDQMRWPGFVAALPVFATVGLIATPSAAFNRIVLSARPVVFVGLISYSWYLWHWPVFTLLRVSAITPPAVEVMLVATMASFVLAILSWWLVERPFRRVVLPNFQVNIRYAAALAIVAGTGFAIALGNGVPFEVAPQVRDVDRAVAETRRFPCLAGGIDIPNFRSCVREVAGKPTIAIIGDSHAAALAPGITDLARDQGWGSAVLTKSSCRPLRGVTVVKDDDPAYRRQCAKFMTTALDWAAADDRVTTVILSGLWTGPITNPKERYQRIGGQEGDDQDLLIAGVSDAVRALRAAGKSVIVMEDAPYWESDPVKARRAALIGPRRWVSDMIGGAQPITRQPLQAVEKRLEEAAVGAGAVYAPLRHAFCDGERSCRFVKDGRLLFSDRSHLSPEGARVATDVFRETIMSGNRTPR